jgi:hypothetical protein
MACRNIGGTISGQEYEWDIAGGQSIGDLKSHFARKLKIERHAVHWRIRDYIQRGIYSRHWLYDLSPFGNDRIGEVIDEHLFILDDQYAFAGKALCHCSASPVPTNTSYSDVTEQQDPVNQCMERAISPAIARGTLSFDRCRALSSPRLDFHPGNPTGDLAF